MISRSPEIVPALRHRAHPHSERLGPSGIWMRSTGAPPESRGAAPANAAARRACGGRAILSGGYRTTFEPGNALRCDSGLLQGQSGHRVRGGRVSPPLSLLSGRARLPLRVAPQRFYPRPAPSEHPRHRPVSLTGSRDSLGGTLAHQTGRPSRPSRTRPSPGLPGWRNRCSPALHFGLAETRSLHLLELWVGAPLLPLVP
jgi:hypothetical protein